MQLLIIISLLIPLLLSAQIKRINDKILVNDISSPLEYKEQPFDVLHYDAELDLTDAPGIAMRGVCRIHFVWTKNPDSSNFFFHLRGLLIDSALYNDQIVTVDDIGVPENSSYHYEVPSMAGDLIGDTIVLEIFYAGFMTNEYGPGTWGGVNSMGTTLFAMGVGFVNNYVSTTQHWLPCYDHPSDKATFHVKFLVEDDKTVASVGLLNVDPQNDDTTIYEWTHNHQCATYLFTFAVDSYKSVEAEHNGLPYVWYTRSADEAASNYSLGKLPDMVDVFEEKFAKYPFDKVGYVNTPIGSMEHQTMISMHVGVLRGYYQAQSDYCEVVAHELAHQWFGDYICPQDFRNTWLNESFATYCESIWIESIDGYSEYINKMDIDLKDYIIRTAPREGVFPLYDYPHESPSSNYPGTIYSKGSVILGMLRYELGDELFFAGIKEYLKRFGDSSATTNDLKKVFEDESDRNLYWFFDQWVYGKGWAELDVRLHHYNRSANVFRGELYLTQVQPESYGTFHNLPVEIGFEYDNGETEYRIYTMKEREQVFLIDTIKHVKEVTVNRGPTLRAMLKVKSAITSVDYEPGINNYAVKVFPNPTDSYINIEFYSDKVKSEINIVDILGTKVKNLQHNSDPGLNNIRIDLFDIPDGVYFLNIDNSMMNSKTFFITR